MAQCCVSFCMRKTRSFLQCLIIMYYAHSNNGNQPGVIMSPCVLLPHGRLSEKPALNITCLPQDIHLNEWFLRWHGMPWEMQVFHFTRFLMKTRFSALEHQEVKFTLHLFPSLTLFLSSAELYHTLPLFSLSLSLPPLSALSIQCSSRLCVWNPSPSSGKTPTTKTLDAIPTPYTDRER